MSDDNSHSSDTISNKKGFFSLLLSQLFHGEPKNRDELLALIRDSGQNDLIDEDTRDMLEGVMDIADQRVRDIMIPRSQMITLKRNQTLDECLDVIIESAHSRFPVISEDKDHIEGILMAKDLLPFMRLQEARNAVDNASREVESRFDFRNVEASFELNDASKTIKVLSESDFQVNQLLDILRAKLLKRGIEGSSLDVPENIVHSGKTWFVEAKLKQGIESATQKKIVKMIKDSKLKVQAQIQGDEIRVTGKSRDDLQAVMAMVRGGDLGQPFQFKNFRD